MLKKHNKLVEMKKEFDIMKFEHELTEQEQDKTMSNIPLNMLKKHNKLVEMKKELDIMKFEHELREHEHEHEHEHEQVQVHVHVQASSTLSIESVARSTVSVARSNSVAASGSGASIERHREWDDQVDDTMVFNEHAREDFSDIREVPPSPQKKYADPPPVPITREDLSDIREVPPSLQKKYADQPPVLITREDFSDIRGVPQSPQRKYAEIATIAAPLPVPITRETKNNYELVYGSFDKPFAIGKPAMIASLNDIKSCMKNKKKDERFVFIDTKDKQIKVVAHNPSHKPSLSGKGYNSDVDDEFTFCVGAYPDYVDLVRDAIASIWPKLEGTGNIVVVAIIGAPENSNYDHSYTFFHVKVGTGNNGKLFINDDYIFSDSNIAWRENKGI